MNFGQYELVETIKQRGPVVTSRASDPVHNRSVVLKTLQREAVTPARVSALRHEYRMIRSVDSGQVVKALDLIWEADCPALVLTDIDGPILRAVLAGRRMTMAEAVRTAISIARALGAVHQAGIMHGDINADNVLLSASTGEAVLIDFGFSERGGLPPRVGAGLRGTPDYIAPELTGRIARGADHRADIYSLGVLLYQMLAGELPFGSGDLLHKVYAHLAVEPRPLQSLVPTAPEDLTRVVAKMMAKQPEQRYQTTAGLIADLQHCLAQIDGAPAPGPFDLGAADIPSRLSVSTALKGREAPLQQLRQALETVRSGAALSWTVKIEGPAGVGKSSLVDALRSDVELAGGLFVVVGLDADETGDPLAAVLGGVRSLCELLLTERYGPLAWWREHLREGMGDLLPVLPLLWPDMRVLTGDTGAALALGPRESAERLVLAIRQFIRLCARSEHPLVLVVEDLQLADPATVAVLSGLARKQGPERMLLVLTRRVQAGGAARDIEADERIDLGALDLEAVAAILGDTFRQPLRQTLPLARAILSKVGGAPLAIGQFLGALADAGTVRFDRESRSWAWNLPAVEAEDARETVVDLLLSRQESLSEEDRAALGAVSCIGRSFTLAEAEAAAGIGLEALAGGLERAVAMAWLAPVFEIGGGGEPGLRFTHERIWTAAATLLSPADRRAAHGRLAGHILRETGGQAEGERLYALARHLRDSLGPDSTPAEIGMARGLNAAAGGAALAAGDLGRGHRHFQVAVELLSSADWDRDRAAALAITAGAAGAAVLAGAFDEAERCFGGFLDHCDDPVQRAGIAALRVFAEVGQNRAKRAVAAGIAALAELGDPLCPEPGPAEVEAEVGGFFAALAGRGIEDLDGLPDAADSAAAAIQQVLAAVLYPAFSSNPLMFAAVAARLAARSVTGGLTEHSVVGFNDLGLVACGPMNQVELGYALSLLAQRLVEKRRLKGLAPRIDTIFNAFIRHRRDPIRSTLPGLIDARRDALASGDANMAALAAFDHAFQVFWIGQDLARAEEAFAEADAFCNDLSLGIYPDLIALYRQALAGLRFRPDRPEALAGAHADGAALLETYRERRDPNGLVQLHIAQMLLAHVFGQREAALAEGRRAAPVIDGITSTPAVPAYFAVFAMVAVPAEEGAAIEPDDLRILERGAALAAYWASQAPDNYGHHDLVLRAELVLAAGDEFGWLEKMEAAADHATRQGFTSAAALVLERIAEVSRKRNRQRRYSHFIRDAWRAWTHYGAEAKLAALLQDHRAELGGLSGGGELVGEADSQSISEDRLDLGALLKATRAISQGMRVSDLTTALLSGVVETAGATSAIVVAPDGNDFRVIAELRAGHQGPVVAERDAGGESRLCPPDAAPLSALRMVLRLRQALSTSDVNADPRLSGDPFFAKGAPVSLAIVPLIAGERLLGLVYLENREVADAFSAYRINVINALCAQAAISWDNAILYDGQARLLAATDRFVPAELARLFERDSIVDVHLSDARAGRMSLMVSDLRGSTTLAERLSPRQTFALINTYLAAFSQAVRDNGGFVLKYVGDGVLAVFPDGPLSAMQAAVAYTATLDERAWDPLSVGTVNAGIAIHSGEVLFGVVGDANRMQIDALSDAVNVTFRLEAMTKRFGARVLVSEDALADIRPPATMPFRSRYLGEVETQGRQATLRVHELIDAESRQMRDAKLGSLTAFEEGLRLYERTDWVGACMHLSQVLRDNPGDQAALGLFQNAARRMSEAR